jgi:acyl carrier protein
VEKKVAEIWQEVLGVERVGLHDSFFELGGHSLVVMRVASRIYKTFNVELSLHDFFKAPTVADLGMAIVLKHTESQDREKVMQALAGLE